MLVVYGLVVCTSSHGGEVVERGVVCYCYLVPSGCLVLLGGGGGGGSEI